MSQTVPLKEHDIMPTLSPLSQAIPRAKPLRARDEVPRRAPRQAVFKTRDGLRGTRESAISRVYPQGTSWTDSLLRMIALIVSMYRSRDKDVYIYRSQCWQNNGHNEVGAISPPAHPWFVVIVRADAHRGEVECSLGGGFTEGAVELRMFRSPT